MFRNFSVRSAKSEDLHINLETLINLRWIAILGQIFTIAIVKYYIEFNFPFLICFFLVFISFVLNVFLEFKKTTYQTINNFYATLNIFFDLTQLAGLIFLTGGLENPFSILFIVPTTVAVTYLNRFSSRLIMLSSIIFCTVLAFYHYPLPSNDNRIIILPTYYVFGLWTSVTVGIIFLGNYAYQLGRDNRKRSTALTKLENDLSKEQVISSVGNLAAAAAHELGTPLATINLIAEDLRNKFKEDKLLKEDVNLLSEQVKRCSDILNKIGSQNNRDSFIEHISFKNLINEIIFSIDSANEKKIEVLNRSNYKNFKINKKIEIVYALRNLIQNAIKFSKDKIEIKITQDKSSTEINISDDGNGFAQDIISDLGQPYLSSVSTSKNKKGMGLGIFISKNLLERTKAKVFFANNSSLGGAEIRIFWKNSYLQNL